MENYSPELERAQLLEEFKAVDAKFNQLTDGRNDARLERAKLLLRMQETFPIVGVNRNRPGWKEWCEANIPLIWNSIIRELGYARDPERLIKSRQAATQRVNKPAYLYRKAYTTLYQGWPFWTDEQRQKVIDRIVELTNAT